MWPLPSSAVIPTGNPFAGLSLVEMLAVATILLAGAIVFSLARIVRAGGRLEVARCPSNGAPVRLVIERPSALAPVRIVYCSKWRVRARAGCDRRCLPKAA